ncbi:MAG: FAD-binding protein [Pseudomonadota bacterium]
MTTHVDVLVIGSGIAGAVAAAVAARGGARVLVCHAGASHTGMSSGSIAVAGALHDGAADPSTVLLAERVAELAHLAPWHPYARIGVHGREHLNEALGLLADLLLDIELVGANPPQCGLLLADVDGRVQLADRAPRAQVRGDLRSLRDERWGLVDFPGLGAHEGRGAAAVLRQHASGMHPVQLYPLTVAYFRRGRDQHLSPVEAARWLDDEPALDSLARCILDSMRHGSELDGLLMPPLIGLQRHREMLFRLQALAGLPVAELRGGLPSVPGLRLVRAIENGLCRARVEVARQRIGRIHVDDPAVLRVEFAAPHVSSALHCRRVILATGSWTSAPAAALSSCCEVLSGAPLFADGARLVRPRVADLVHGPGRQGSPLWRAGLLVDESLRPLDASGIRPVHPGLFAAGAVIAGNDRLVHGAGLGLCALTGWVAGTAASS